MVGLESRAQSGSPVITSSEVRGCGGGRWAGRGDGWGWGWLGIGGTGLGPSV